MSRKFRRLCAKRFAESAKGRCFFKIPQWQQKRTNNIKRGKLVSYFSSNVAKTRSHELNISRDIGIKYFLHFKAYFMCIQVA